jgi:hypothetical protein
LILALQIQKKEGMLRVNLHAHAYRTLYPAKGMLFSRRLGLKTEESAGKGMQTYFVKFLRLIHFLAP